MKKHEPITLNGAERIDLASITKHPGMDVVFKILDGHALQQLQMIKTVEPDDPDRTAKLDGIGTVGYAMELTAQLVKQEISRNWEMTQKKEEKQK